MQVLMTRFAVPLLFLLALLFGAPLVVATPAATNHPTAAHDIGSVPAGLVAAIARTQAQDAAGNPAYAIGHNGCAKLKDRNNAPVLASCFGKKGPAFSVGRMQVSLRLSAWGHAGQLRPVTLKRTAPQANRIAYRGKHIAEWWRVLPLGYEQGFMIEQTPVGQGKVILELTASRMPTVAHGTLAWGKLRYGKLQVTDAAGHVLPATLSARGRIITLAFDAAQARYPVTVDPLVWVQQQEVTVSNGVANDFFGYSVALSSTGTTALVGAYGKTVGGNYEQGAAYVFTLGSNGAWSQAAELTSSDGLWNNDFGAAVALSADGTTALVSAYDANSGQGAAYVFTKPSGGWSGNLNETAEFTSSNGVQEDNFGYSISLSSDGRTALVGAPSVAGGLGAAYVFTSLNGAWSQVAELTALNGLTGDHLGWSVALSGDGKTALAGAPETTIGGNQHQGAAYVFTLLNTAWSQTAELTATDGAASDHFGWSVALSGDGTTALVGAYDKTVSGNQIHGAAYAFTDSDGAWNAGTRLVPSNGDYDGFINYFGWSAALSGDGKTALIGATIQTVGTGPFETYAGAAYLFGFSGGTWAQTAKLTASDAAQYDEFGYSVALSDADGTVLAGAPYKTVNGNSNQGAAYFFTPSDLSAVFNVPANVQVDQTFDSQYILTNASATASAPVTVELLVPGAVAAYASATASQGICTYDNSNRIVSCDLGAIAGNGGTASAIFTLKATGAAGATIVQSVRLADGGLDLARTASIAIFPVPPTVNGTSNLTVGFEKSGTETFTTTGTGTLTVAATSSNPILLPNANITGAASCTAAGSCPLTLTPTTHQSGRATVTVTVTDSYGQSGSGMFTFSVNPRPAGSSGGGAFGPWGLLGLCGLALLIGLVRRWGRTGRNGEGAGRFGSE